MNEEVYKYLTNLGIDADRFDEFIKAICKITKNLYDTVSNIWNEIKKFLSLSEADNMDSLLDNRMIFKPVFTKNEKYLAYIYNNKISKKILINCRNNI
jgi:hypothetical protein